jgi:uncharacterized membrane protein YedE/YeeE
MTNFIIALGAGCVLWVFTQQSWLTKYNKIINVYRFTDMTVLKFMMTALVVSMSGLYALRGLGLITFPNVPATYIVGNLVGGIIFGFGMALSGYCPGTCSCRCGEGKLDYLIPGLFGFLVGAVIYGLTYDKYFPRSLRLLIMAIQPSRIVELESIPDDSDSLRSCRSYCST